jgi:predicted metal-binding membrane protein
MWTVMMAGMMLPSALPATLLYGSMVRGNRDAVLPATWMFAGGYLAVWTGFALAATLLQAALEASGLLTPAMASASRWLTGGLLVLAGIYQWLPLKDACLGKCRAPLQFFLFHWRPGPAGAFRMGAEHGVNCVGCCWALMLLLFFGGVMSLLWIAAITAFVLLEKLAPYGVQGGRLSGLALALAGIWVLVSA